MKLRRLIMVPAVAAAFLGAAALGTPNSAAAAPLASNDSVHAIADVSYDGAQNSAVWSPRGIVNEGPAVEDRRRRRHTRTVIISTGGGIVFPTGGVVRTNNCNGVLARRVVVRRVVVRTNNCGCNNVASNVIVRRTVVRPTVIIIRSGRQHHQSANFVSSGLRFR